MGVSQFNFMQTIVSKGQQMMDAEECVVLDKLGAFLDRLCTKYGEFEIQDSGFDPADNYDRKTLEGKKRCCKVSSVFPINFQKLKGLVLQGNLIIILRPYN